jgi:hypothetical protein
MELIQTITLTGTTSAITFSTIPQNATDLVMVYALRAASSGNTQMQITLNSSTTGYVGKTQFGNGSATGVASSNTILLGSAYAVDSAWTANTFSNGQTYFPLYAGSGVKSFCTEVVTEQTNTTSYQSMVSSYWNSTAAITSIAISLTSGNMVAGSTASLYKITKA